MAIDEPTVIYRDVPGFPGYRVGDDGSVWSRRRRGPGDLLKAEWHRLLEGRQRTGHRVVGLCVWSGADYRVRTCFVHRLVLEAFVGPCPDGMQACHGDGNPANNRPENLRWDTIKANSADRIRHGTDARGEKSCRAKINRAIADAIRARYADGATGDELAAVYGIGRTTVYRVLRGESWA